MSGWVSERARAFVFLVAYSCRRQLRSRKTLLSAVLLAMIAVVVFLAGYRRPWTPQRFGEWVVLRMFGLFYLPVLTLMYGTGALGDDRDEKSLVYLVTRPFPRWSLFVGKLLGVAPYVLVFSAGGLCLLHIARERGVAGLMESLELFLPAILFGALAYTAFFHFLGAAFRHSTLVAIAYVFFVELFLGRVPGIMKRLSISFYTWSILYEDAAATGLRPIPIFLPVSSEAARIVLVAIAVSFLAIGAWIFARREYGEAA